MFKSITKTTSNNHPDYIIGNILLRSQVEDAFEWHLNGEPGESWVKDQSVLSDMYDKMKIKRNTIIPNAFINNKPGEWQAYLENISDFLLIRRNVMWKDTPHHVEFLECNFIPPPLRHFRAWTLREEQQYIDGKWKECLKNPTVIPANKIKCFNG